MQRIIQINIAGSYVPIEEDACNTLDNYINSLKRHFTGEEGREIIEDIESRIAELFSTRLQAGAQAIDLADVQKVIETLGTAKDLGADTNYQQAYGGAQQSAYGPGYSYRTARRRLMRNPFDKIIGGVCSGISVYFDVDPVIVRVIMAVLFLTFGIGLVTYIIAWAVIPAARSERELYEAAGMPPVTFHDITSNVGMELQDLKRRGERMSSDLADFFRKKK